VGGLEGPEADAAVAGADLRVVVAGRPRADADLTGTASAARRRSNGEVARAGEAVAVMEVSGSWSARARDGF
jgi:hypothetical protein